MESKSQMQREEERHREVIDQTSTSATGFAQQAASTPMSAQRASAEAFEYVSRQSSRKEDSSSVLDRISEAIDSTVDSVKHSFWNRETQSLTIPAILLLGTGVGAAVGLLSKSKSLRKRSSAPDLLIGVASGIITASILTSEQRNEITQNISSLLNVAIERLFAENTAQIQVEDILERPDIRSTPESEETSMEKVQPPYENRFVVEAASLNLLLSPIEYEEDIDDLIEKVCSDAKIVYFHLEAAPTVESFIEKNCADQSEIVVEFDFKAHSDEAPDVSHIAIMGIYPSKVIRSLPAEISLDGNKIIATIDDPLFLLDPEGNQPTINIPSFQAQVTLFAVEL
jgi:hypothetical protein